MKRKENGITTLLAKGAAFRKKKTSPREKGRVFFERDMFRKKRKTTLLRENLLLGEKKKKR